MAEELAKALNIDMSGPKTYENLFKKQKEIGDEITKVEMGVADLTASRDLNAAKARQESISKAQEKYDAESSDIQKKMDSFGDVKFQPTQDNIQDIAGLFSAVGIIGAMIGGSGRNSAMNALSSMTGMMEGWKQGRADLFRQEKIKFDTDLNKVKLEKDALIQKLNMVEKEYSRNKEKAEQDFQVVLAQYNSPILKQMANIGGLKRTAEYANSFGKAVDKTVEFNNQLTLKGIEFENQKQLKQMGTATGDRYGFGTIVATAANESAASMRNIMGLPLESTSGIFGGRSTNSLFTAPAEAFANQLTSESTQRYNTEVGKLSYTLSQLLKGGRVVSVNEVAIMDNILKIKEGDTINNAATKLAEARQIAERAMEVRLEDPNTPPSLKEIYRDNINTIQTVIPFTVDDINKFVTKKGKKKTFSEELQNKYVEPQKYDDPEKEARYQKWKKENPQ